EISHTVRFFELAPKVCVLFSQPSILQCAINDELELFDEVFCLQDVVECAHLQRLDCSLSAGKSCQEDKLTAEPAVAQLAKKVDAGHVGHFDIGNDEIEFRRFGLNQSLFGAWSGADDESFLLQKDLKQLSKRLFVIDNQNLGSFGHRFLSPCSFGHRSMITVVPIPFCDRTAMAPLCA